MNPCVIRTEDLGVVANGLSGFLAAFWSSLTLCPTELVKCRLQAMRESNNIAGRQNGFYFILNILNIPSK